LLYFEERECVDGILASLCLSIYFLIYFIYLFILVLDELTLENVKGSGFDGGG